MFNVVTIAREYGSGGADIGRKLAELLGWERADKQIIERVAAMGKVDTSWAAEAGEQPNAWWQRVMKGFRYGDSWSYSGEVSGTDSDFVLVSAPTLRSRWIARVLASRLCIANCVSMLGYRATQFKRTKDRFGKWNRMIREWRQVDAHDYPFRAIEKQ